MCILRKKEKIRCPECNRKMKRSIHFKGFWFCRKCRHWCTKSYVEKEKQLPVKALKKLDKIIPGEINKN